jgi:DNA-binding IclR family transcriptional regulator
VIARIAAVLRALEGESDGLSLAQIAGRTGLARSTVHRLAVGLAQEGFVMPASPSGRVRLGPTLARLAAASDRELRRELEPYLRRLADALGETIDLAVLDGPAVRFVDQIPGSHRLRAVSSVGDVFPLHCTANGKAFLAALGDVRADELLPSQLEALTPNTITSRDALRSELAAVRESGLAFDREEHTLGICAVGSVVRDVRGPVAAVTVVVPAQRFQGNEQHFGEMLVRTCREINARLGAEH